MSESIDDDWIDEQLRNVPVPPELLARLGGIAAFGDRELDRALCDLPLPPKLLARLHAIGSLTDTDIDDDARHVSLPTGVVPRLRRSVRRRAWQTRLAQLAVAAALAIVIGGSGWLLTREIRNGGDLPQVHEAPPAVASAVHNRPTVRTKDNASANANSRPINPRPNATQIAERSSPSPVESDSKWPNRLDLPPNWLANGPTILHSPPDAVARTPSPRNPDDDSPLAEGGDIEMLLSSAEVLGNSSVVTEPDLRVARGLIRGGVSGPRLKGYNLAFEFSRGEHPVVYPEKNAALLESRFPVWTETTSYELTKRELAAHRLPPSAQIRAEDFLAAMDYNFPPPTGAALGIRTAAGPSPIGSAGTSLIQIGVRAAQRDRGHAAGTHLTLAVDASSAVAVAGRWDAIRRALKSFVDQLGPRDRVSLVVFSNRSKVLARQADRREIQNALDMLEGIKPQGVANLEAALEAATAVARGEPTGSPGDKLASAADHETLASRLLLLTDGLGWIDPGTMPRIESMIKQTVAAGVSLYVVDVRPDEVIDPRLDRLAVVARKKLLHAPTTHSIAQELRQALVGGSDVVAAGVSIKIKFNPEAIENYRLIGFGPSAVGGLFTIPLEGDLRSDEATTALYEVELKPEGAATVATVEVTWHEPGTEEVHRVKQPIGRLQFAPSWFESPLSLQLAAIAAETAETLHGSVFISAGGRPLDQVAEMADRANAALQESESFQDLQAILAEARNLKSSTR
jgi:Mg-chelatase subunit ChlD